MGSRLLRHTLYMAALTGLRYNPILRALGQRLRAKGKPGKLIVAAAMRKLLRLIYGVLKQGRAFDPHWPTGDRAVGLGGLASDGDKPSSPPLVSPSVATA
jgi:transposase